MVIFDSNAKSFNCSCFTLKRKTNISSDVLSKQETKKKKKNEKTPRNMY